MKTKLLFLFAVLVSLGRPAAQTIDSLRIINPGLSPAVVSHGRVELALFNQLSTEKSTYNFGGLSDTYRFTSLYHVLQAGYGLDKHNRLNAGGTFIYAHVRSDLDEERSPFAVLGDSDSNATVVHHPAAAGVYLRGIPFRRLPELTVQGGVLFPGHAFDDGYGRGFANQYLGNFKVGVLY